MQEAVAVTQRAVNTLGEKVHLLDTAGGLTASPGLVPAEARTALEAARLDKRLGELKLKLLGAQTDAAEHKAQRLGAERDLCTGIAGLRDDLTRLEAQTKGSAQALGDTVQHLVQEAGAPQAQTQRTRPLDCERPLVWRQRHQGPPGERHSGGTYQRRPRR